MLYTEPEAIHYDSAAYYLAGATFNYTYAFVYDVTSLASKLYILVSTCDVSRPWVPNYQCAAYYMVVCVCVRCLQSGPVAVCLFPQILGVRLCQLLRV